MEGEPQAGSFPFVCVVISEHWERQSLAFLGQMQGSPAVSLNVLFA